MLAKRRLFSIAGVLGLLLAGLLLFLAGTELNTIAAYGISVYLVFIVIFIVMLLSGGLRSVASVAGAIFIYMFRLTISRLYRPVNNEVASDLYKIISNDWSHLFCVFLLLASIIWLLASLIYSETSVWLRYKYADSDNSDTNLIKPEIAD